MTPASPCSFGTRLYRKRRIPSTCYEHHGCTQNYQCTPSLKAYMTSTDTRGPHQEQELLSLTCLKQEHLSAHALLMHGILVRLPSIIDVTTSSSHQQEGSAQVAKPHSTRSNVQSQKRPRWVRPAALRNPSLCNHWISVTRDAAMRLVSSIRVSFGTVQFCG